ncbi:MAG: ABC transporter ATP-binding protein [Actinomycetales bacterium]|nr:ABC transporter ATP-binding protein [Actinomycetales bacterium]
MGFHGSMESRPSSRRDPRELISFEDVGVVRDGGVLLLEATGTVGAGEILALTGANGAGKTTLLRVLAGLLEPTAGTVRIAGRAPDDRDRAFRTSLAALIGPPQTARDLTVAEHLRFIAATWGTPSAAAAMQAEQLLEELAIQQLGARFPHELSSGQTQLVALALTLARPARVLLLDEPEQRLDAHRLGLVSAAIRRRAEAGAAIVMATHSPRLREELAEAELALEGVA